MDASTTSASSGTPERNDTIDWLLSIPTLLFSVLSCICCIVVFRITASDLLFQRLKMKHENIKKSNDYLILALINFLIVNDFFYTCFMTSNVLPGAFDAGEYSPPVCLIIAVGAQFFSICQFLIHIVFAVYLIYVLRRTDALLQQSLRRHKKKHRKKRKHKNKHTYSYSSNDKKFIKYASLANPYNIRYKLYLFATESTITFSVIVVLSIAIICTIIPAVVNGNHYGSYPSYFDKNNIEYGITCWVVDQYSTIVYVVGVLSVLLQIVALYIAWGKHKQNESTNYNIFNSIIQKRIQKLRERQRERLQDRHNNNNININNSDLNMTNINNFNNNSSSANSSGTSSARSSIQRDGTGRSSHESSTRTLLDDEQSIISQTASLTQSLTKRAHKPYKHIISQLLPWVLIYTVTRVIAGIPTSIYLVTNNYYDTPLWIICSHDWIIAAIGITDAVIWCFAKTSQARYRAELMFSQQIEQNERLIEKYHNQENNYNNYNHDYEVNYNPRQDANDATDDDDDKNVDDEEDDSYRKVFEKNQQRDQWELTQVTEMEIELEED